MVWILCHEVRRLSCLLSSLITSKRGQRYHSSPTYQVTVSQRHLGSAVPVAVEVDILVVQTDNLEVRPDILEVVLADILEFDYYTVLVGYSVVEDNVPVDYSVVGDTVEADYYTFEVDHSIVVDTAMGGSSVVEESVLVGYSVMEDTVLVEMVRSPGRNE